MLTFEPHGPVLLAGGYGVVGRELTALLRRHHGEWPLVLAGRHPERVGFAEPGVTVLRWDLDSAVVPDAAVRAVVTVANDDIDTAMRACLTAAVPYVDVTRWTARLQRALAVAAAQPGGAPVMLSSGWMGGLVPRLAGHLGGLVGGAVDVDVAVRYDTADRSGADSVDFMDRLGLDFEAGAAGAERTVTPLTDVRRVTIGADLVKVARIDTPEQFTLPLTLGVRQAVTRLGFSDGSATAGLLALRRLGFFRIATGERLRGLRRSLLHRPGSGGEARLRVAVAGREGAVAAMIRDPAGQAHLTAVGALLSLRDALNPDTSAGVAFPELAATPDLAADLRRLGVDVDVEFAADVTERAA
ncbi:hypothetical protein [Actinoplanes sp. NPDC049118]|uniref:hypothetical protein n=1 Tax=Actinoplanes sp. NPDC049118 TaxID=3155769 RepID=UPI0033F53A8B